MCIYDVSVGILYVYVCMLYVWICRLETFDRVSIWSISVSIWSNVDILDSVSMWSTVLMYLYVYYMYMCVFYMCTYDVSVCILNVYVRILYVCICRLETFDRVSIWSIIEWLWLVGSSNPYVSSAKEPYKLDYIVQKRPIIYIYIYVYVDWRHSIVFQYRQVWGGYDQ